MKVRHVLALLSAAAVLFSGASPAAGATAARGGAFRGHRDPDLIQSLTECSAEYLDGDKRLGPVRLPVLGVVGAEVSHYRRTGGLSAEEFLHLYWNPAGSGGWYYPPQSGYVLNPDGSPKRVAETLQVGQDIDRYGSEYGSFLAPEGLPYAERSIPPSNLDSDPPAACNYHDYRVVREFTVFAGPIAPWFAQPGLGRQYQLDPGFVPGAPSQGFNVGWLVANGYLERII